MDRRTCLKDFLSFGICCSLIPAQTFGGDLGKVGLSESDELTRLIKEKEFIINWTRDLLETMDKELDLETKIKLIEGCGRGCFKRFKFKQDIAEAGKGSIDNLLKAYQQNFEIWKDEDIIHIRYGEISKKCYCPAAQIRDPQLNDLHCECTRTTHQTIFETALGIPVKVKVVESLRRGGKTCHFKVII